MLNDRFSEAGLCGRKKPAGAVPKGLKPGQRPALETGKYNFCAREVTQKIGRLCVRRSDEFDGLPHRFTMSLTLPEGFNFKVSKARKPRRGLAADHIGVRADFPHTWGRRASDQERKAEA